MQPETLRFLSPEQVRDIAARFGTPVYVMSDAVLRRRAAETLAFPNAFGLTVRYAMKANPNRAVLKIFHGMGLQIDASSGHEVERALAAGIPAAHITLSSQELPRNLGELLDTGIGINASSLQQIRRIGECGPGRAIGLRFNPGLGSGGTQRTNVGGPASSFGLWHAYADSAAALLNEKGLRCVRIHTHIGSGSDPAVWQHVAGLSLHLVRRFADVTTLDLGGGFKVARMSTEKTTDLQQVGLPVRDAIAAFAAETGRRLHLEIEPGTYLAANAGAVVSTLQDRVDTGADGYVFYRLDTGMTDVLRPSLYGAQHPIVVVPREEMERPLEKAVVVGHCCESGDILTPAPGDPEALAPRLLLRGEIGDFVVIEGAGAYCSAMCTSGYNSFPASAEVLLEEGGGLRLIRKRQETSAVWANEVG
jgi:diaminopimelate decarboxylase